MPLPAEAVRSSATRLLRRGLIATVAILAGACAPLPPVAEQPLPPAIPETDYRQARERGEAVYRIVPEDSLVVVRVYRGGRLARLGHDHVVASRAVAGLVLLARELPAARADLVMPLDSLTVDEPALRAAAGLDTTPSAADIEGTRRNMLDKTLHAAQYPYVALTLRYAAGSLPTVTVDAAISLHGVTVRQPVEVALDTQGEELGARGRFTIRQTDFGIAPFSIFGGALEVQDRLDIEFALRARRW